MKDGGSDDSQDDNYFKTLQDDNDNDNDKQTFIFYLLWRNRAYVARSDLYIFYQLQLQLQLQSADHDLLLLIILIKIVFGRCTIVPITEFRLLTPTPSYY